MGGKEGMQKRGGEKGPDEDLTDWAPGGNLQKAAISGKKGKCEVTQGEERGGGKEQEGECGQHWTRSPRVGGAGGAGCRQARGSGSLSDGSRAGRET